MELNYRKQNISLMEVAMRYLIRKLFIITLTIVVLLPVSAKLVNAEDSNKYPVILVHGNAGWGREEKAGFLYWGGNVDLEAELQNKGYDVRTAVVAPFSSNWDRACELYAYITGADRIDYGKAHSQKFGHDRFVDITSDSGWANVWVDGGLYPEWGQITKEGINKIHLIGHSQGGQTVRLFVQLLEEGMRSEVEAVLGSNPTNDEIDAAVKSGRLSALFTGKHNDWVKSVSTFATPNDGTTSADIVNYTGDILQFFSTPLNSYMMDAQGNVDNSAFNLKVDQWNLTKESDESYFEYALRCLGDASWKGTKDFSNYDLSTYGAREINKWVKDQPNIYYFSYSCLGTRKAFIGYNQVPADWMNPTFNLNARAMGAYINYLTGITSAWLPNDGYVNTISENGPKKGRVTENIVNYDGEAQIGKWNHIGLLAHSDHEDIIGRNTTAEMGDLVDFYSEYIDMLYGL